MSFMSISWKRLAIGIRHQVTEVVDCLPVVLDWNSLVVAVKTSYVFRIHKRRWEAVDVPTEFQVMYGVGVSHQQPYQESQSRHHSNNSLLLFYSKQFLAQTILIAQLRQLPKAYFWGLASSGLTCSCG